MSNIIYRLSTFLLIIGSALLVLFIGSSVSGSPIYVFVPYMIAAFILGFLFRRRAPKKTPSGRFRIFREFRQRGHKSEKDEEYMEEIK